MHELLEKAYLDKLTNIPNRNTVDLLIDNYKDKDISSAGCALISISNLPEINQKYGRASGDNYLKKFAASFERVGDRYGFVGRNSGNEFVLMIDSCDSDRMQSFVNDLIKEMQQEWGVSAPEEIPVRISFSYALNAEEQVSTIAELLSRMYQNKKG